jgi:hypothetical protein
MSLNHLPSDYVLSLLRLGINKEAVRTVAAKVGRTGGKKALQAVTGAAPAAARAARKGTPALSQAVMAQIDQQVAAAAVRVGRRPDQMTSLRQQLINSATRSTATAGGASPTPTPAVSIASPSPIEEMATRLSADLPTVVTKSTDPVADRVIKNNRSERVQRGLDTKQVPIASRPAPNSTNPLAASINQHNRRVLRRGTGDTINPTAAGPRHRANPKVKPTSLSEYLNSTVGETATPKTVRTTATAPAATAAPVARTESPAPTSNRPPRKRKTRTTDTGSATTPATPAAPAAAAPTATAAAAAPTATPVITPTAATTATPTASTAPAAASTAVAPTAPAEVAEVASEVAAPVAVRARRRSSSTSRRRRKSKSNPSVLAHLLALIGGGGVGAAAGGYAGYGAGYDMTHDTFRH